MTVEANPSLGRARRSALYLAGAALFAALMASPAFAGCGSSGVSSGSHPPSVSTGVQVGATAPSGSTGGGSSCATGISHATKLVNTVHPGTSTAGAVKSSHVATRQNFKFLVKPNGNMGPHRHNP